MDMILILYVNDLLLLGEDLSKIEDEKCQLGKLYQMKDLGPASSYLGIRITQNWDTWAIWIDQQVYIETHWKGSNSLMQTTQIHHSLLEFI